MKKRFSIGKDEYDFTKPAKLTRQKRLVEAQKEFVRLEQQASEELAEKDNCLTSLKKKQHFPSYRVDDKNCNNGYPFQ